MSVQVRGQYWRVIWIEDGKRRTRAYRDHSEAVAFDEAQKAQKLAARATARSPYQTPGGEWCVPLTGGEHTLVDAADIPAVEGFTWYWKQGYAITSPTFKESAIPMHRLLMRDAKACNRCGAEGHVDIHHRNETPLDNRRENLEPLCVPCHQRHHIVTGGPRRKPRTHCPHGHEYTPENTVIGNKGDRRCRECHRARSLARYYRLQAEGKA